VYKLDIEVVEQVDAIENYTVQNKPVVNSPLGSRQKMDANSIYAHVNDRYGATARAANDASYGQAVASAFGYSSEELASIPQEANLGLSCGNPLALANLKEGETIVDLGSGAGFDVFLAAKKVGETGKAIGVDMNEVGRPSRELPGNVAPKTLNVR
jgi:hypothetical protein